MKRQLFSMILILAIVVAQFAGSGWVHPARAAGPTCYVDDTAVGANDGSSWPDAFTDLQSALGDTGCTRIEVAAGTYYPSAADMTVSFELRSGVAIYGGYPDGGAQTPDPETYAAVLSGNIGDPSHYDNAFHVVHGENADQSAVLDGFTIQDGRAQGPWIPAPLIPSDRGGGLYIENSNPTLRNLHINSNSAWMGGGGMYLLNSSPSLENVDFWLNQFVDTGDNPIKRGGGLWIDGDSSPQLTNVNVTNNQAEYGGGLYCSGGGSTPIQMHNVNVEWNQLGDDSKGGGIYLDGCAMTMEGGSIVSNAADDGGGIWSSGHVSLTDVDFSRNIARAGDGGGLYSEGAVTMTDCLLEYNFAWDRNFAPGDGGAIFSTATASLERVTLDHNHADGSGGGMRVTWGGTATIRSSQFKNNTAHTGGGLCITGADAKATVRSSQFSNNSASLAAGGLYSSGTVTMTDCLVDQNYAGHEAGGLEIAWPSSSIFTNLAVTGNSTGNWGAYTA